VAFFLHISVLIASRLAAGLLDLTGPISRIRQLDIMVDGETGSAGSDKSIKLADLFAIDKRFKCVLGDPDLLKD